VPPHRGHCRRHGDERPCSCAMGNLYRFIEPVLLYLLLVKGEAHGYDLALALPDHHLTDSDVDRGALYRTLRALEVMEHVTSSWDVTGAGPARRVYRLTSSGIEHLREWLQVMEKLGGAIQGFVADASKAIERRSTS